MGWNYDMSQAPKGRTERRKQKGPKGQEIEREVFVADRIIACAKDGEAVTVSYWIPKEERWCMFATGEQPLCWQPWPSHPGTAQ